MLCNANCCSGLANPFLTFGKQENQPVMTSQLAYAAYLVLGVAVSSIALLLEQQRKAMQFSCHLGVAALFMSVLMASLISAQQQTM